MAAIFDTENNEFSQDDYVVPVFAVNDDSGVSYGLNHLLHITEYHMLGPCTCLSQVNYIPCMLKAIIFMTLHSLILVCVFLSELHFRISSKRP